MICQEGLLSNYIKISLVKSWIVALNKIKKTLERKIWT